MAATDHSENVETPRASGPAERRSRETQPSLQRRAFLATSVATIAGLALWQWRKPRVMQAAAASEPKQVTIVLFSDSGQRLKTVHIPRVVKTEDQWRKQ